MGHVSSPSFDPGGSDIMSYTIKNNSFKKNKKSKKIILVGVSLYQH
jgi:hypothetical protein